MKMRMRALKRLATFLVLWATVGSFLCLGWYFGRPYLEDLLSLLVFGRLTDPLAAVSFTLWVFLSTLLMTPVFPVMGFAMTGPVLMWAHERWSPKQKRIRRR